MAQTPTKSAEWLESPAEEEGLRRYVETIRERLPLVGVAVAVTTLVAILYVLTAPKTYEARADLLVTPVSGDDPVARSLPVIVESVDPTRDVETASQFVTNIDVAAKGRRGRGFGASSRPARQGLGGAGRLEQHRRDHGRGRIRLRRPATSPTTSPRPPSRTGPTQIHESIEVLLPPLEAQLEHSRPDVVREELGSDVARCSALLVAPAPDLRVETKADLPTSQASPQAGAEHRRRHARRAGARDRRRLRRAEPRPAAPPRDAASPPLPAPDPGPHPEGDREPGHAPLGPDRLSRVGAEAYRTLRSTLEASRRGDRARG